jgi:1-acyl-sn-glycerol-3-phosphate acyltransferase
MSNIEGVHRAKAALAVLVGAYGRRKGANDMAALRTTFELSRTGEAIGLFPEGDRSWDGSSAPIRPGAGKLVRRLGVPLVLARQKGNYLAHPRWASRPRRGPWSVEFSIFGAEELARCSDGLAEAIVSAAIRKNEIKDAIREGRSFECAGCAEGVERLLWRCPVCGRADTLRGAGDVVSCRACAARWELDANCRVRPLNISRSLHAADIADLKDWSDWQARTLPEFARVPARNAPALSSEGVVLSRREGQAALRIGSGRLYLKGWGKGSELVFEASGGRTVFEASAIRGFVDNFNEFSEFDHRGQRWRLEFRGGNALKWAVALSMPASARVPGEAA